MWDGRGQPWERWRANQPHLRPDRSGLVVALHGRGASAEEMQMVTELDRFAAEHGLVVVYPESLDGGWGDDASTADVRKAPLNSMRSAWKAT